MTDRDIIIVNEASHRWGGDRKEQPSAPVPGDPWLSIGSCSKHADHGRTLPV
jgi:hypothetical protein